MDPRESFITQAKATADTLYQGRTHARCTIGILENGKIETVCFNPKKEITDRKLIYPVGSINKIFTASLLAKQMSEGKIDLHDSLSDYIPGLPERYYPDLQRLLTHHSGYGGAPFSLGEMLIKLALMNTKNGILHVNPFRGYPDEAAMIEIIKKMKLKDKSYKFEYSNLAYGILGYIAGKVDQSDFFTAMEKYFKELGLKNTSLKNSNFIGFDKKGNPCKAWQWERTDIIAPAGAMLSSAKDMLKFAEMNMDGSLPYLDIMFEKYAEGEKTFDQGLAWRLKKDSDICYHVGNAGAFSCILAMDRKKKKAAFIGLNYAMVEIEELAFALL